LWSRCKGTIAAFGWVGNDNLNRGHVGTAKEIWFHADAHADRHGQLPGTQHHRLKRYIARELYRTLNASTTLTGHTSTTPEAA
jgi:hypothetical protein